MKKTILLILDGWGVGENSSANAIFQAHPPYYQELLKKFPNTVLHAREELVGLPKGCLSGSEVGHLTLGAGRIVWQNVAKIDKTIADLTFFRNPVLQDTKDHLMAYGGKLHLVGLLSNGGIHSHINHLTALINWAKKEKFPSVSLHLFLDGRDMPPMSAIDLIKKIEPGLTSEIKISTMTGRSLAMDRGEKWERTKMVFDYLTQPQTITKQKPQDFLNNQYQENIGDEFVAPTNFDDKVISSNDAAVFFNFRADRMRQMVRLFLKTAPSAIQQTVTVPNNLFLSSLTEYDSEYTPVKVMYPPEIPVNTLGEWISQQGLKQFRITETEKYAHVTYFFNGGRENVFNNESRMVIPSLGLTNYTTNPEMSLAEIVKSLSRAIELESYELIVTNFANGDMVGHSGDLTAGIKAVLEIDKALAQIIPFAATHGYTVLITADHGNIELMNDGQQPHTAHTFNHVPLIITDPKIKLASGNCLHQVSPTILKIMNLPQPKEMTSLPLIK
ncbi:MAG TPA: 2,3-bisphosphoglycerate-independent phosphoglycerate mutase [Candidatus Magasanikbacteria bacterium]|nr:2,3-bisphosphoglycerate-independent phosphoglycerate mutase [Candidatus Magasanikbacteria bacterium]